MIIFGTRGVTTSAGTGDFHCPQCRTQLPYTHRRVRRFFTLYFIPVIPMDTLGEYVECHQCRGTYKTAVLDFDPAQEAVAFEAEFHQAVKLVMVLMMLADGVIEEAEVATIQDIYHQLTQQQLSQEQVQQEIQGVQQRGDTIHRTLGRFKGQLNDQGKEMVVSAAYMVAISDGHFDATEEALLTDIGQAIDMSPAHLRGVISSFHSQ